MDILEELKEKLAAERAGKLDNLGKVIAKIRDEAVAARQQSGLRSNGKRTKSITKVSTILIVQPVNT